MVARKRRYPQLPPYRHANTDPPGKTQHWSPPTTSHTSPQVEQFEFVLKLSHAVPPLQGLPLPRMPQPH